MEKSKGIRVKINIGADIPCAVPTNGNTLFRFILNNASPAIKEMIIN